MIRLLAALAFVAVAAPATAQDAAETAAPAVASAIDQALVGDWTLLRVNAAGAIARYGAQIEDMRAEFGPNGTAEVRLSVLQDRDVHERTRTFQFRTANGQIVTSGAPSVGYEVLGGDLLVLSGPDGMVVELRRVGGR